MKFYLFNTSGDKVNVNYSLSLGLLNTEHKLSVKKKRSSGPVRDRSTGPVTDRSTGVDFEFSRSGRVEKILTGSISASKYSFSYSASVAYARGGGGWGVKTSPIEDF